MSAAVAWADQVVPAARPFRKRVVIGFAGAGLSSEAVKLALGFGPHAVMNHWDDAVAVHRANNPLCDHFCADILETDPHEVLPGEDIGLACFSPDCRHFSKAKGGTPVSPRVRGLAWVVIEWARKRRPDVILMENVEEWLSWGPLVRGADGHWMPDPDRKGETAEEWFGQLRAEGYQVEFRVSSAADLGGKTRRRRLMVIARCDGLPIVWPQATHAPRDKAEALGLLPHVGAYTFIDFERPCFSIFMDPAEAKALGLKRPLRAATERRIAKGIYRETIAKAVPFTIAVTHHGDDRVYSLEDPAPTITGANRGEIAFVAPHLVKVTNSRWAGDGVYDATCPLPVVTTSKGGEFALVAAHLEQANTGMVGHDLRDGLSTLTQRGTQQRLITAQLTQLRGTNRGKGDLRDAGPALTAGGSHQGLLTAHIDTYYSAANESGGDLREPIRAATSVMRHSLIVSQLSGTADHRRRGQVLTFLQAHFGAPTADDFADPLASPTSRARFGIVLVPAEDGPPAVAFITDICMRMLDPETELAAAMGVPPTYRWEAPDGRKMNKVTITKMVGNGVELNWFAAHVRANCADLDWYGDGERLAA